MGNDEIFFDKLNAHNLGLNAKKYVVFWSHSGYEGEVEKVCDSLEEAQEFFDNMVDEFDYNDMYLCEIIQRKRGSFVVSKNE